MPFIACVKQIRKSRQWHIAEHTLNRWISSCPTYFCVHDCTHLALGGVTDETAFLNYLHYFSYANVFIRFDLDEIFQSANYKNTKKNLEVPSRNTTLTGEYIIIQKADRKQSWIEWKPNTFTVEGDVNWERQCKFQITTIVNELIITLKIASTVFHE